MTRPGLEYLESRCVLTTWGNPWPDATHLTLSFAPDGTPMGNQTSQLFKTFDAIAPRAVWQQEILRAFQSWAEKAGINISLVEDQGQAFGSPGRPQGDSRFGDIRIGGGNYSTEVLAFSTPFDATASTWAGDIRINTAAPFGIGSAVDLYTAILQEAGHSLGIGNSADPNSVMYEVYRGPRTGLSAGDVSNIQALYGPRTKDQFEGNSGNESLSKAAQVNLISNGSGVLALKLQGDLTTRTDRDTYAFRAPTLTGALVIQLHRSQQSFVTPRVTVFDSLGRIVDTKVAGSPTNGDLEIRLNRVTPLGQYYVQVESAGNDAFAVGSYELTIQSLQIVNFLTGTLGTVVENAGQTLVNNDLHTNDSIFTSSNLLTEVFSTSSRFDYAYQASISDIWDVDYYRITAPANLEGDKAMTVMAWGIGASRLSSALKVFDSTGKVVACQVLMNENGVSVIQLVGAVSGATYYVKIEAGTKTGPEATGNYFLGIDFGPTATRLQTFVNSTIDAARPERTGTLQILRTSMFRFVLSNESTNGSNVQMTIRDSAGTVIEQVTSGAGQAKSITVQLIPGTYTFTFTGIATSGELQPTPFKLQGIRLTDPIGPQAEDPTTAQSTSEPQPSSGSTSTNSQASTGSGSSGTSGEDYPSWYYQYYWYQWQYENGQYEDPNSPGYKA